MLVEDIYEALDRATADIAHWKERAEKAEAERDDAVRAMTAALDAALNLSKRAVRAETRVERLEAREIADAALKIAWSNGYDSGAENERNRINGLTEEIYKSAIQVEIEKGDKIIETGSNDAGKYTKMISGKVIMFGYGTTYPCQTLEVPVFYNTKLAIGRWR
jgi:ATPase subunit of ABC transporter with duplicated ATPase domains